MKYSVIYSFIFLLLIFIIISSISSRLHEKFTNPSKNRVVVCFYGVVNRSIKYTYYNLKKRMINILKKKYNVDIYIFNNNIEYTKIDNTIINNNDLRLLKSNFVEEEKQSYIDHKINNKISNENIICKMRKDYSKNQIINAIRQMYSEEIVGNFLLKHINDYKCAIVCGPDYFLLNNINLQHVRNSIGNNSSVYTTTVNDAQGFTNGFYIGALSPMIKILRRYSILKHLLPTNKDYEFLLKKTFEMYKINRLKTNMKFVKIRSNKQIAIQGEMSGRQYNNTISMIRRILGNLI